MGCWDLDLGPSSYSLWVESVAYRNKLLSVFWALPYDIHSLSTAYLLIIVLAGNNWIRRSDNKRATMENRIMI